MNTINCYSILFAIVLCAYLSNNKIALHLCFSIILLIITKSLFNYEKCTFSYIECKLRGVKKHDGYIYQCMDKLTSIKKSNNCNHIYTLLFIIALLIYIKKNNC